MHAGTHPLYRVEIWSRSRTRCLKTGLVCYLSPCEKLQKNPACFWNCSTHVLRDITKVGENRFTMPVRGEKLLQNLQFINKLIELCSKGRFDMFTEEGDGPYLSSKRCPPRREPSLRKKRAQTRTEEVNHRSPLLEPQPVQLQAWVNGQIERRQLPRICTSVQSLCQRHH